MWVKMVFLGWNIYIWLLLYRKNVENNVKYPWKENMIQLSYWVIKPELENNRNIMANRHQIGEKRGEIF